MLPFQGISWRWTYGWKYWLHSWHIYLKVPIRLLPTWPHMYTHGPGPGPLVHTHQCCSRETTRTPWPLSHTRCRPANGRPAWRRTSAMSVSWPYAANIDQFFATVERAATDASISQDGCVIPIENIRKKRKEQRKSESDEKMMGVFRGRTPTSRLLKRKPTMTECRNCPAPLWRYTLSNSLVLFWFPISPCHFPFNFFVALFPGHWNFYFLLPFKGTNIFFVMCIWPGKGSTKKITKLTTSRSPDGGSPKKKGQNHKKGCHQKIKRWSGSVQVGGGVQKSNANINKLIGGPDPAQELE